MQDIAIVGAGPYGLSLAAHLSKEGVDFRIFGKPMKTWRDHMPKGMHLKSEGFASCLYDPDGSLPLSKYCADNGLAYADTGLPVSLDVFTRYGREFQKRFVPALDERTVVSVRRAPAGFEIGLEDGEIASFRRIILAIGITHYAYTPDHLAALPPDLASHASTRHDLARFAGRSVAVVGGGASATDCAVALVDAGAAVHLVARRPGLRFHDAPGRRSLRNRMLRPVTTIGASWKSVALTRAPLAFHAMPEFLRHEVTRRHLGPAPCWFTRSTIESDVDVRTRATVTDASAVNGRVRLAISQGDRSETLDADHVIAATGYRVDLDRLTFLDFGLRAQIRSAAKTPILSRSFESSVPGLYFVGASAANAFGPLVRFACGAEFTAHRLSRHLARTGRPSGRAEAFDRGRSGAGVGRDTVPVQRRHDVAGDARG